MSMVVQLLWNDDAFFCEPEGHHAMCHGTYYQLCFLLPPPLASRGQITAGEAERVLTLQTMTQKLILLLSYSSC